jgi:hypothetical protein
MNSSLQDGQGAASCGINSLQVPDAALFILDGGQVSAVRLPAHQVPGPLDSGRLGDHFTVFEAHRPGAVRLVVPEDRTAEWWNPASTEVQDDRAIRRPGGVDRL